MVLVQKYMYQLIILEKAKAQLDEYRRHTIGMAGRLGEYQALLVDAYVALQQRERAKCHALLRVALDIASRQRYRSHWNWFPKSIESFGYVSSNCFQN